MNVGDSKPPDGGDDKQECLFLLGSGDLLRHAEELAQQAAAPPCTTPFSHGDTFLLTEQCGNHSFATMRSES